MNILDKIKPENYTKFKNDKTLKDELIYWILNNTDIQPSDMSISEMVYIIRNDIKEHPRCLTCNALIQYKYQKYAKYCSSKCSANAIHTKELRKQTVNKKYGCDNVFQSEEIKLKLKQTNIHKYGIDNPFKIGSESFNNKMRDKYGTIYASQVDNIKDKIKNTSLLNYGTDHPMQNEEYKEDISRKRMNTTYSKLLQLHKNVKPMFTVDDFIGCGYDKQYTWLCTKCNNTFKHWFNNGYIANCPTCSPKSKFELDIFNTIQKYTNIDILRNSRSIIDNTELDIFIPTSNIAIECNGNYWHSELHGGKNKNYHLNKTKLCNEKNIRLIHIFEDEWVYKQKIVKNRLKSILGLNKYKIYARKCIIKEIDNKTKSKFLNKYHIQGDDKSSIRLGCFYKNKLVAVMTFGLRRYDDKDGYELIRYATIAGFTCVGCASKLLKYFERTWNPSAIISYADLRWSEGNVYKQLEFTHLHNSKPNYYYMKDHKIRESRIQYQKHKLKNKLKIYDPNLTEWENMQNNEFDRIWDCGNMVFEKVYK